MFEKMRNDMMVNLHEKFDNNTVTEILNIFDNVSRNYSISTKETAIVPYNYDMPEIVKIYLVSRGIEGVANSSLNNYRTILKLFFSSICKTPEQIDTRDIRLWLFGYQQKHNISNRTLDSYRVIINGFFVWAKSEGYISDNPCSQIKAIKYVKKPRKAMNQIELEYIRGACNTLRDKAIVEVLYSTGCRVSELSNIKLSDINWTSCEVQLFGKGGKYRTSYLNAKAVYSVQRYLEQRDDNNEYLFVSERKPHNRIGKSGIERIVKIISDSVRDKTGMNVTPHIFRHTCATVSLSNGADVTQIQRLLGHVDVSTTMVYAEVRQNDVANMHSRCVI